MIEAFVSACMMAMPFVSAFEAARLGGDFGRANPDSKWAALALIIAPAFAIIWPLIAAILLSKVGYLSTWILFGPHFIAVAFGSTAFAFILWRGYRPFRTAKILVLCLASELLFISLFTGD